MEKNLKSRIIRASAVTLAGSLATILLGIVVRCLIARTYGPDGLGIYSAFMLMVTFFSLIAFYSLYQAVLTFTAEYEERGEKERIRRSFSTLLTFVLLSSLVMGVVAVMAAPWAGSLFGKHVKKTMAFCVGLTVVTGNASIFASTLYQGLLRNLRSLSITLLSLFVMFVLALYGYLVAPIPIYMLLVSGYFASALWGVFLAWKNGYLSFCFSGAELKRALIFILPLLLMAYLGFLADWLDRAILGICFTVREMGIYSAALAAFAAAKRLPLSLTNVMVPSYSKINVEGREALSRGYNKNVRLFSVVFFFIACGLGLYARDIILILFGTEFEEAVPALRILSVSFFLSVITNPGSSLLVGCGYTRQNMLNYAAGVAVLLPLLLVLTRSMGVTGTALSMLVSHCVTTAGMILILTRAVKLAPDFRGVGRYLFFALGVLCACAFSRRLLVPLYVHLPVFVVLYWGGFWFRLLTAEDKASLVEVWRKGRSVALGVAGRWGRMGPDG